MRENLHGCTILIRKSRGYEVNRRGRQLPPLQFQIVTKPTAAWSQAPAARTSARCAPYSKGMGAPPLNRTVRSPMGSHIHPWMAPTPEYSPPAAGISRTCVTAGVSGSIFSWSCAAARDRPQQSARPTCARDDAYCALWATKAGSLLAKADFRRGTGRTAAMPPFLSGRALSYRCTDFGVTMVRNACRLSAGISNARAQHGAVFLARLGVAIRPIAICTTPTTTAASADKVTSLA